MTKKTISRPPEEPAMLEALEKLLRAFYSLMPALGFIAVQDYALINEAPIAAEAAIRQAKGAGVLEEFPYVYRWAKRLGMPVLGGERKGQLCKVLVRGKRNSCLIEFPDGLQAVTSRNALRRAAR